MATFQRHASYNHPSQYTGAHSLKPLINIQLYVLFYAFSVLPLSFLAFLCSWYYCNFCSYVVMIIVLIFDMCLGRFLKTFLFSCRRNRPLSVAPAISSYCSSSVLLVVNLDYFSYVVSCFLYCFFPFLSRYITCVYLVQGFDLFSCICDIFTNLDLQPVQPFKFNLDFTVRFI